MHLGTVVIVASVRQSPGRLNQRARARPAGGSTINPLLAGCWFTAAVNFVLDPSPMLLLPAETPVSDWRGEFQPLPPEPLSGGDRNLLPDGMVLGEPRTDTAETLHHCQAPGAVQEVSECVFDLLPSKSQVLIPASTSKLIHLWLTK